MSEDSAQYVRWLKSVVASVSSGSDGPYISVPIGAAIMWGANRIAMAIEKRAALETDDG